MARALDGFVTSTIRRSYENSMRLLSEQEIEVISAYPLDWDDLDRVRAELRAKTNNIEAISSLLIRLIGARAAFNLEYGAGAGSLASRLVAIHPYVKGAKLGPFLQLARHVVDKSPDTAVWAAVFDLVDALGRITPPRSAGTGSIPPTFLGTPVARSSSWLDDSETCDRVERELFGEIKRCTFRGVKGFWDRFFLCSGEQRTMLGGVLTAHNGKKWAEFPSTCDEQLVWRWFRSLEDRFLTTCGAPHKLHTTNTANQFRERKGQLDLFFQKAEKGASTFEYKDILVVGGLKKANDTGRFKTTLLQLARYVRGVFADQPTRRFVHAFSLCASTMELWIFDRSGPYSSGPFDIHGQPDKFARALVGYATMGHDDMGLDTFIERDMECANQRHVTLHDMSDGGGEVRIRLTKPMVYQRAIVCRGTTCYETEDGGVAKFSWASDKRKLEVEHLRLAEERGVKGVARVVAHGRITTIADMRKDLVFPSAHRFREDTVHFEPSSTAASSKTASSQKRKSASDNASDNISGTKRQKPSSSNSKIVGHESSEHHAQLSKYENKPSLYTRAEEPWENRIYSCLVVSPAGRVISDFRTAKELLEAIRDAITAHRSLYMAGNILHRDISSNNIIITDPNQADGFKGMLIDLDLAKVKDSGPSGARHQTGTIQFMAVEVFRTVDHTYRHDLESFFYVLLWMCARQSWRNGFARHEEQPPQESLLRRWEVGSFKSIAASKASDMAVHIRDIMGEFPRVLDAVKPLCLRIRKILFPLDEEGDMFFGTPSGDPDQLYRPIIEAYDQTITGL